MASTPKKARFSNENQNSKIGYLQTVSPIKVSKSGRKYFNATFQTKSKFESLVAFKHESHKTFTEMAKAKTPVCLSNTDSIPSVNQPGEFDIMFKSFSTIQCPKETVTFPYQPHQKIQEQVFDYNIKNLKTQAKVQDKGEIYWFADNKTECPLTPSPMPDTTNNQNMMYLWISDYMFDSIGYVAQKHDFLVRNLTQADLPAKTKGILNTTCTGLVPCVGTLIPQIGKKYPNAAVELRMKSTTVPKMSVSSAGVSLNASGIINMYATRQKSSQTPFLISLGANATTSVKLSIHDELVFAEIQNLKVALNVLKSDVGDVSGTFLDFLVKEALNVVLIPQLNELGKKGFPLPVTDEIKFTNTKLSFAKDTILISTDLQYTSKAAQPLKDMSGPLKFVPHVNTV